MNEQAEREIILVKARSRNPESSDAQLAQEMAGNDAQFARGIKSEETGSFGRSNGTKPSTQGS